MQKLLSIVVPVYKVEPFINKCLDSCLVYKTNENGVQVLDEELMNQLEVIIVNDGTPDNSAEMSREYVKRYPQTFRQIDKENGGHGSAWNVGVKEAHGRYIKFLDSDDWLENLALMMESIRFTHVDLIVAPYMVHEANTNEMWKMEVKDVEFGKIYNADSFDWQGNGSEGHYYWHQGGIYSTEMMRRYYPLFLERQPYDDTILLVYPVVEAKSLVAWDIPLYHYLIGREGQSVAVDVIRRNYNALIKVRKSVIQYVETHPISDGSTKKVFLSNLLKKQYQCEYVAPIQALSYMDAKQVVKQWDKWVRKNNHIVKTKWICLYRIMPFCLYWIIYSLYCFFGKKITNAKNNLSWRRILPNKIISE